MTETEELNKKIIMTCFPETAENRAQQITQLYYYSASFEAALFHCMS